MATVALSAPPCKPAPESGHVWERLIITRKFFQQLENIFNDNVVYMSSNNQYCHKSRGLCFNFEFLLLNFTDRCPLHVADSVTCFCPIKVDWWLPQSHSDHASFSAWHASVINSNTLQYVTIQFNRFKAPQITASSRPAMNASGQFVRAAANKWHSRRWLDCIETSSDSIETSIESTKIVSDSTAAYRPACSRHWHAQDVIEDFLQVDSYWVIHGNG